MTSRRTENRPDSRHKSHRVSQIVDPRTDRTCAALARAFAALLSRRSYARIRVSDIVRKAGIGRATFYAHFESKEALLRSEIERVVLPMLVELPTDPCIFDCTRLFAHVQQAREIYRSLMAEPGHSAAEHIVQKTLEAHIARRLTSRTLSKAGLADRAGFVARFVASTILTVVAWSLEQTEPPPAAQLQQAYRGLVGRALSLSPADAPMA